MQHSYTVVFRIFLYTERQTDASIIHGKIVYQGTDSANGRWRSVTPGLSRRTDAYVHVLRRYWSGISSGSVKLHTIQLLQEFDFPRKIGTIVPQLHGCGKRSKLCVSANTHDGAFVR